MTCIVAAIDNKGVHMAADSLFWNTESATHTSLPKIVKYPNMLLGIAGNVGDAQHMVQWFNINHKKFSNKNIHSGGWTKAIRAWLNDRIDSNRRISFSILLALKKDRILLTVDDDLSILPSTDMATIGSGSAAAMACWKTMHTFPNKARLPTKAKLLTTLEITACVIPTVREPFIYEFL
jgi:ATP-dependent protease HslVU (ClpYQ) peptidase subunit